MRWPALTLGELTATTRPIQYGVLKPGPNTPGGVPLVRVTDISTNTLITSRLYRISGELDREFRRTRLTGGELLVSVQGTVGKVAIVPSELAGANVSRTIAVVDIDDRAVADFVRYWLLYLESTNSYPTVGSTRASLNIADLRRVAVPIPPLEYQRRIAATLKDQFDSVRVLRASSVDAAHLAVLRKTLTSAPFRLRTDTRIETPEIGSIARIQSGYAFRSEWFRGTGVRLLRNANVGHRRIDWMDSVYLDQTMETAFAPFQLREGDIVLSLDRPVVSTGLKVARLTVSDVPSLLLQRVARLMPSQKVDPDYLFAFLLSPQFEEAVSGHDHSVGVPHISPHQVGAIKLPLPALEEQRRIAAELRERLATVDAMEMSIRAEREAIEALPAALLKRVFGDLAA